MSVHAAQIELYQNTQNTSLHRQLVHVGKSKMKSNFCFSATVCAPPWPLQFVNFLSFIYRYMNLYLSLSLSLSLTHTHTHTHTRARAHAHTHTCPRRNVPDFGSVFLMLKYTDITRNTYTQSWTVTEIMASEVWKYYSCYTLIDYQIHIKTGRNMWFL
jgi:hypothetical protein